VATLGEDYAFPHTQIGGFIASFCLAGGEIPRRFWVPLGTADFSSIFPEIPDDVDALMVTLGGADAVNFLRQADEFGVLDRLTILAGSVTVDATILETAGDLVEGVMSGSHYAQVLPYPEFVDFNTRFEELVGRPSSLFAADYYIASKVAIAALLEVDGAIEDQEAYREALLNVEMDTPRGPFSFDEYHNVVLTAYINEVQSIDGVYRNVVRESFPNTTQFGPFDPDWYQSQPSFDRTNPVCEAMQDAELAGD
jgi:branched-chain amino acid transport system substrate-binding protein